MSGIIKFIFLMLASLVTLVACGLGFIYTQNLWSAPTITSLEEDAAQGDAEAQYQLALRYKNGTGTPQNFPKAIELFTKASEQNHAEALNSLGIAFREGKGALKDFEKAITYFERADKLNFHEGTYNLAFMHENGLGTKQDYSKAVSLYRKAISLGSTTAKARLGRMYMVGLGQEIDFVKAYLYLSDAADEGNAYAQFYVGWYYEFGKGTVASDINEAIKWYEMSAAQNFPESLSKLGYLYSEGKGVEQDYLKAGEYFYRASAYNNANAIEILKQARENCSKEAANNTVKKGLPSCFIAASTRDPIAMYAVGFAYHAGLMNLKRSYENAFSWFLLCAEYGYAPCQVSVGSFYKNGSGVEKNSIEAYAWLSAALNSKHLEDSQIRFSEALKKIIYKDLTSEEKAAAEKKAKQYANNYIVKEEK
ncbi:MAG: sel1 repeat family protein [Alphaproteobacteria bacterium]|nr:sel1 repeat family protein [Alphaproteobacteria bacterium]